MNLQLQRLLRDEGAGGMADQIQSFVQFPSRAGALVPLGPGLVPYWGQYAYNLVGGDWDESHQQAVVFGPEVAGQRTIAAWTQVDFLLGYWLGRHHGLLGDGSGASPGH